MDSSSVQNTQNINYKSIIDEFYKEKQDLAKFSGGHLFTKISNELSFKFAQLLKENYKNLEENKNNELQRNTSLGKLNINFLNTLNETTLKT